MARAKHRVVALAYRGVGFFELGMVAEVFGVPRPDVPADLYRFSVCSLAAGQIGLGDGVRLRAERGLRALREAGTIVVPGWADPDVEPPAALVDVVRRAHRRGVRLISICSGAFVLAAAGALDGRRATTHWHRLELLRERYPRIHVEPDALYVEDANVLTSAGSAAGIDLCLHVVRCDHGAAIANRIARYLVVPPHREGGQSQYVQEPVAKYARGGLAPILDWALTRIAEPLGVRDLARQAKIAPRTFARKFVQETGNTPHRWLVHQRLLAAQRLLERGDSSIEAVAEAVGFATAMTFRHHFRKTYGLTPASYRRRFSEHKTQDAAPRHERARTGVSPVISQSSKR